MANNNNMEQVSSINSSKQRDDMQRRPIILEPNQRQNQGYVSAPARYNREVMVKNNKYNNRSYEQSSLNPMEVIAGMMSGIMLKKEDSAPDYKKQNHVLNDSLVNICTSIQKFIITYPDFGKQKLANLLVKTIEDTDVYKIECKLGSSCPKLYTQAGCECQHSEKDMKTRQLVMVSNGWAKNETLTIEEEEESF
jgi:hypothetical protein